MVLKNDWLTGDTYTATAANDVATQVNTNTTDITNKQPLDSDLTTIAGLTATTDNFMVAVAGAWASRTPAQAKTSLALAKGDVGLGNVDNTSDATKDAASTTLTNKTITNPTVNNYTEGVVAIGNTSTAKTIDLTSGTVQTATLTGNCTFTMPTATAGKSFVLLLKTGAGSFTGTFTSVKWPTAGAPVITTAASKMDILTFVADGSVWYGSYVQGYTP